MGGGDSNRQRDSAAESSSEGSAASHPGGPAIFEDPGNREVPLVREAGDPFEEGLSDDRRAARLEGARLITRHTVGKRCGEVLFRVDRFRRYLPRRGSDGRGLIQFWGPRAVRLYELDPDYELPAWTKTDERKLHTVGVGEVTSVVRREEEAKKKIKIKR